MAAFESRRPHELDFVLVFDQTSPAFEDGDRTRMEDEITEKVLSSIASVTGLPRNQISENTSLASLGIDSLDVVNLLFDLEEKFKISIPGEPNSITNANQIIEGIRRLTSDSGCLPK